MKIALRSFSRSPWFAAAAVALALDLALATAAIRALRQD